jgi:tRNA-binding protein
LFDRDKTARGGGFAKIGPTHAFARSQGVRLRSFTRTLRCVESPAIMETPNPTATQTTITYDDFAKIDLRIATVLDCKPHPNADKLLVLQIDLGSEKRQICAGLRQYMAPEQLIGKQIVVVANLAPRTMRGEVSNGMLLAASDAAKTQVIVVSPIAPIEPGSKVS